MTRLCFPFVNASGDLAIEGAIVSRCRLMWFLPYQGLSPEELGGDRWHCNPIRPGGEVVWHLLLFESFCHAVCDDLWEYEKCHSECQQVSKPTNLFLMTRRLTIYTESVNFVEGIQVDALAIYSWLPTAAGGSDVGHLSSLRTTQAPATVSCQQWFASSSGVAVSLAPPSFH